MAEGFDVPILFLVFNRPDRTKIVFEEIRKQKPEYLFIHADGPRENNREDIKNCALTRGYLLKNLDWKCELKTLFRDSNLGCGKGPASAIDWFFKQNTEGIIIEDDCVPHPDFFQYNKILLEKYRNNDNVMMVGSTTYHDKYPCTDSYTFTIYGTMAAWGTWKRSWQKYDYYLSLYNRQEIRLKLKEVLHSRFEQKKWLKLYDWIINDNFSDYWDWQFQFLIFLEKGLAIRPKNNLIKNIGTGEDATHTQYTENSNFKAYRETHEILPLKHPEFIRRNKKADASYYKKMFKQPFLRYLKLFVIRYYKKIKN